MTVDDIMTRSVRTVSMDDTVRTIRRIFEKRRFNHVVVVEAGQVVGIISDRDVLRAISPYLATIGEQSRDTSTLDKRAHQIMTRDLVTVQGGSDVEEAAKALIENGISCVPVIDPNQELLGIVTWKDLLQHAYKLN